MVLFKHKKISLNKQKMKEEKNKQTVLDPFDTRETKNYAVITIPSPVFDDLSHALKGKLIELAGNGFKNIIINFLEVTEATSYGLTAIIVGDNLCSSQGGYLVLCNLQPKVLAKIKKSHLDKIWHIAENVHQAEVFIGNH